MRRTKSSDSSAVPGSMWLKSRSSEKEPAPTRLGGSLTGCDGTRSISLRGRLKRSLWRQASDHEPNHREVNQRFRGFRQTLIVGLEPTMAPQPSERTFHNPAPLHHSESALTFWLAHDL